MLREPDVTPPRNSLKKKPTDVKSDRFGDDEEPLKDVLVKVRLSLPCHVRRLLCGKVLEQMDKISPPETRAPFKKTASLPPGLRNALIDRVFEVLSPSSLADRL